MATTVATTFTPSMSTRPRMAADLGGEGDPAGVKRHRRRRVSVPTRTSHSEMRRVVPVPRVVKCGGWYGLGRDLTLEKPTIVKIVGAK